ncbi:MAG: tetratricopeptide repeat protein [Silicimonas sp.]|nr:tetratricopeptide repeat protein [Silicimonas sp.]
MNSIVLRGLTFAVCMIALSACDSSEERAEKHFQSGLELIQSGDLKRAFVELRNVLALNSSHRDARATYARLAREEGNISEAYAQFLRLSEQFPDDMEARLALAEMSILAQGWDEAERHGNVLIEANSELDGVDIVKLALEFRKAVLAEDASRIRELTREAEKLADTKPNNEIIARLLLEGYLSDGRLDDAIETTRAMIAAQTENPAFYSILTELLAAQGDNDALEAHLRVMIETFPEEETNKGRLIGLLLAENRQDEAEAFVRSEVASSDDKPASFLNLVALVRHIRGDEAALAEIEANAEEFGDTALLKSLKAGLLFDLGRRDEAISLLQSVTDGAEPSAEIDGYKVALAKMLASEENEVGARKLVEEVLAHDSSNVEALKMRAVWQIESDQPNEAIATLRLALDQAPDDAEAMTFMARAHERNGDSQLAHDLLALAVEASNGAPAESLRFAQVQISKERYSSAEDVLVRALRRTPANVQLLAMLGRVHAATSDWPGMQQVIRALRNQTSAEANVAADELELQLVAGRQGREESIKFLEQLADSSPNALNARIALVRARLQDNQGEAALELARELATELAGDPRGALVLGNTQLALADYESAEATFRAEIERDETNSTAVLQLVRALSVQDRLDEAAAQVDRSLETNPDKPDLLWAKASLAEKLNDIDGAIAIYEQLYEINGNSDVVANNLASLLATYRSDAESLDRALVVGKRLRDTKFPPFQDTYGWILYRQGEYEAALGYLESAAAALSNDPIVQFHLAKVYMAVGRDADALAQFSKVGDLSTEDDPRPQIAEAKSEVLRLSQ